MTNNNKTEIVQTIPKSETLYTDTEWKAKVTESNTIQLRLEYDHLHSQYASLIVDDYEYRNDQRLDHPHIEEWNCLRYRDLPTVPFVWTCVTYCCKDPKPNTIKDKVFGKMIYADVEVQGIFKTSKRKKYHDRIVYRLDFIKNLLATEDYVTSTL